ncbi:barstar family protein [Paenirhodobacter populi]|uniref:Barnase inhibitor n=1 Tax=Paenirhodobacter populi TaxID=2306993 RepID=A0A443IJT8_9RHOB|nr:barstar family protein [Sinirhodobacter populi]RWR04709.1 barnase inhibitor [Sinirhodobacter populi]
MIRTVTISCLAIRDWETFHDAFEQAFGFAIWYGRNLNARIDCMSWLDKDDMSDFKVLPGEIVLLELSHASELKRIVPDILTVEMAAFCNWRRTEKGYPPLLLVSCYA